MAEIDDFIAKVSPYYKARKEKKDKGADVSVPGVEFSLTYDSTTETLEPIYFWMLDEMNKRFKPKNVEKIMDNFASSPGSGHFSELQGKASQMQQEASRILGTVNNILKGALNLIYDLKEFKIRLSHYDAAKSSDANVKEAGNLALKQIWMDKVDIQRGQGSLNALSSGNLQFVTLRDAFMIANSVSDIKKMDLNDRVKRILEPRVQEFLEWKLRSEQELRKRFEIEKIYLKSQVEALKLNARWAKPYLRAAQQLMQNERMSGNPALVTAFNTIMLDLSLMGKSELDIKDYVIQKRLPREFRKFNNLRKYSQIVIIDLSFRGIPSKVGQHYTFGGRAEINFRSYALNEEELTLVKEKMKESDLSTALGFIQGMTDDSLAQLKLDIDELLEEDKKEKKEQVSDPFTAMFSFFKSDKNDKDAEKEKLKKLKEKGPKKENYAESYLRALADAEAKSTCYGIYDIYKKGVGMAAFPYSDDYETKIPRTFGERLFKLNEPKR
ncbi:Uncharacterised protein [uncultured archaeon]|nr:Uncharacterised protein [uncultured archaeon]